MLITKVAHFLRRVVVRKCVVDRTNKQETWPYGRADHFYFFKYI